MHVQGKYYAFVQSFRSDDLDIMVFNHNFSSHKLLGLIGSHRLARYHLAANVCMSPGFRSIDGVLIDSDLDRRLREATFVEDCWEMPFSSLGFSLGKRHIPEFSPIARTQLQISEEHVVFGAAVDYRQCTRDQIDCWIRVIERVPRSVLLLIPVGFDQIDSAGKQAFFGFISRLFQHRGLDVDRFESPPRSFPRMTKSLESSFMPM